MADNSFSEVNRILARFVPAPTNEKGNYTLERMRQLMGNLGNPQNSYKTIHVAGTSGKTSTAYYIANMLKQSGNRVGLTISPHVDAVNERVQINLRPLPVERFAKQLHKFLKEVERTEIIPTYFELLVAFAFWEFAQTKVDYAVVEVGLGGLLDGTNVIDRTDKVCVITDIGFDHVNILGNTLEQITAQKAGIIQPRNTVYTFRQAKDVSNVIGEVCTVREAQLHQITPTVVKDLPRTMPAFQRHNWLLAYHVVAAILKEVGSPALTKKQLLASTQTYIPARMEIVQRSNKTIVLDGAHNAQKIHALVVSLKEQYPNQKIAVIFSLTDGKELDIKAALTELLPITSKVIITTFHGQQDLPKHSIDPEKIAKISRELNFSDVSIIPNATNAFDALEQADNKILLVTGSFYLLNHIRPLVMKRKY